jgi:hypothetical protein
MLAIVNYVIICSLLLNIYIGIASSRYYSTRAATDITTVLLRRTCTGLVEEMQRGHRNNKAAGTQIRTSLWH